MFIKKIFIALGVVLVTSLGSLSPLNAHDTDIYSNPTSSGSEPLILFALDYRSNLGATACGGNECDDLINAGYMPAAGPYTFFDLLRGVFRKVLDPLGGFKIGFMMNHDQGSNCAGPQSTNKCSNGGYIIHGLKSVTPGTDPVNTYEVLGEDPNKVALFEKLDHIPLPQGNVSHSYQGKELYFELFRYLTGQGIYNAHNGYSDYGTTGTQNIDEVIDAQANGTEADGDTTKAWLKYDTSIEQNANSNPNSEIYKSPLSTSLGGADCTGIFVINIMFQVSNQEDDSDIDIKKTKANGGMAGISLQGQSNSFDTVLKWMYDVDLADGTFGTASNLQGKQNVTSYFLTANANQTTNGYADAGGTTRALLLSSDPAELEREISSILNQILSVSTTFVAPSVAVNVYNRSQVQNDVFIAMFQAEKSGKPAWVGNTKKFEFGELNGVLGILDANGLDAVNPIDGRVKNEALSFWTNLGDPNPNELIDPVVGTDEFLAGADGRFVDRGGCGSRIPGYKKDCSPAQGNNPPSCSDLGSPGMSNTATDAVDTGPRKVFTEPASGSGAFRNLNADGSTASQADILAAFTGASAAGSCANNEAWDTACNLIRYTRGLKDDGSNRDWFLGDPLHSRPLALNYGDPSGGTNQDIRVFFGSNDGLMHMVRNTTAGGAQDGVEGWSFMPLEAMSITRTIKENVISSPHQYGVDGSAVAYVYDDDGDGNIETADGDKVYVYFGLRRGGRAYYGLDVSNPDSPRQLWKTTNNSTGFSELGQSWSTPKVGHMLFGNSTTPRPVLIFAGGYDENKDTNNIGHGTAAGGTDSMGRGIFIMDAVTGNLVWSASYGASTGSQSLTSFTHSEMLDSIPSDVTAIDTDGNGLIDRIYVGDTGGKVWRVDMLSRDQTFWTATKLFSAGRHYDASSSEDRRFFYAPDYVQARESDGSAFDAIIIGTGDRENPLDTNVNNWFYVIKDTNTLSGAGVDSALTPGDSDMGLVCEVNDSCGGTPINPVKGWRLPLLCPWQASGACGEKALATAITIAGKIYFTTYQPAVSAGTSCDPNEGAGYLYIVDLNNGDAVEDLDLSQAGLEYYTKLSSGGIPSEVISLGGGKLLRPDLKIENITADDGFRTFWFEHAFDY